MLVQVLLYYYESVMKRETNIVNDQWGLRIH